MSASARIADLVVAIRECPLLPNSGNHTRPITQLFLLVRPLGNFEYDHRRADYCAFNLTTFVPSDSFPFKARDNRSDTRSAAAIIALSGAVA